MLRRNIIRTVDYELANRIEGALQGWESTGGHRLHNYGTHDPRVIRLLMEDLFWYLHSLGHDTHQIAHEIEGAISVRVVMGDKGPPP